MLIYDHKVAQDNFDVLGYELELLSYSNNLYRVFQKKTARR